MKLATTWCALCLLTVLCLAGAGCATVTGGASDEEVTITSNPPHATVCVDGEPRGQTPTVVKLTRRKDHQLDVSAAGYETAHVSIGRELNPWFIGNIAIGGLIGMGVDLCTGAYCRLSPDAIAVTLQPKPIPPAPIPPQPYPAGGP
jgi:hypothetical protein